jgi:thiamine-monophosphate kinase
MLTLETIGEHEAIRRLTALLGRHPDVRTGTGDDCAVTQSGDSGVDQVFTTDPVIEAVHFLSSEQPERIGNKAAGRVLSDIAAMGAQPQWLLVNVVATPEQDVQALERIYTGMVSLCKRFGATLIGGDLARGPCLELHVFGTGIVPAGKALLRSGAQPGDQLFTTGPLGRSDQGKHLDFTPCVKEGLFLRESGLVHAMMDISDGLATDLRHIMTQSRVGAMLEAEYIPAVGSLEQALYDGEDFELLFSVPAERVERLISQWTEAFDRPLFRIGAITDEAGRLLLQDAGGAIRLLEQKAFEHFSTNSTGD